jgi:hypothetical protein
MPMAIDMKGMQRAFELLVMSPPLLLPLRLVIPGKPTAYAELPRYRGSASPSESGIGQSAYGSGTGSETRYGSRSGERIAFGSAIGGSCPTGSVSAFYVTIYGTASIIERRDAPTA